MMAIAAKRLSDNKMLYFRDEESKEEYSLIHEDEELEDAGFCFNVPFGEVIIDCDEQRKNLELMLKQVGLSTKGLSIDEIYGKDTTEHSYADTDKRIEEYEDMTRTTYDFKQGQLIETDDNAKEVAFRKAIAKRHSLFRAFLETLDDVSKERVKAVFSERHLDLDKIEKYFDKELNRDLSVYIDDKNPEQERLIVEYENSPVYKKHKHFVKTLDLAYEAVRQLDKQTDINKCSNDNNETAK